MKSFKVFVEELKKVGGQLGSNPGGVHVDTDTGEKHYVKFYIEKLSLNFVLGFRAITPRCGLDQI